MFPPMTSGHPAPPGRGRREAGDLRGDPRRARRVRLRPTRRWRWSRSPAKASKATLYRRWNGKVSLVIEALHHAKGPHLRPRRRPGSLREDLLNGFCGAGGLYRRARSVAPFASALTAIARDADFAEAFRRDVPRPQARPLAADLRAGQRPRRAPRRRSTSTCSSPPSPGSSCTDSSSSVRPPTRT